MMNFRWSNFLLAAATLLTTILVYLQVVSALFLLLAPAIWVIALVIGSANIRMNYFLQAYHLHPSPTGRKIAITFDDGPNPTFTPKVLELLTAHGIKATFFCIGKNAARHPALMTRISQAGHLIGNHSFSHATTIDFGNTNQWIQEIKDTDTVIEKITGKPTRFFRPPYGVTTPHLANALKHTHHLVIGWSIRPYDTTNTAVEKLFNRITKQIAPGAILLLHDTHENIIPLLERLLPYLKTENYNFVTVEELIST